MPQLHINVLRVIMVIPQANCQVVPHVQTIRLLGLLHLLLGRPRLQIAILPQVPPGQMRKEPLGSKKSVIIQNNLSNNLYLTVDPVNRFLLSFIV